MEMNNVFGQAPNSVSRRLFFPAHSSMWCIKWTQNILAGKKGCFVCRASKTFNNIVFTWEPNYFFISVQRTLCFQFPARSVWPYCSGERPAAGPRDLYQRSLRMPSCRSACHSLCWRFRWGDVLSDAVSQHCPSFWRTADVRERWRARSPVV